jgi:hypothetical protein
MLIGENIEAEVETGAGSEKARHTVRGLYDIVQEIIGFGQNLDCGDCKGESKYLNINNILNSKSEVDRYR